MKNGQDERNPAVVGAGQYDGNGAVLSCVMPRSSVRWLRGVAAKPPRPVQAQSMK